MSRQARREQREEPLLNLPALGARRNVREQVAEALRAAMVAGEMRPGVVYSAPVLAARFGVSATPVREAMLDLAKEGLVTAVRNKGFRVTALSDRDLDEITEVRELIEVPTVQAIADSVAAEKVGALRPLAEAIVTAAESRDVLGYIEADHAFHLELLGLAGNAHLVEVVQDLRHRSRLYGVPALAERGGLVPSAREHLELLDAIAGGDGPAAAALMRHHLRHVRGIWADRPESG
jgi:DNA-binding GntR family transcriptional regulator